MKSLVRNFILLALLGYSTASMALSPGVYVSDSFNRLYLTVLAVGNGHLVLEVIHENKIDETERYAVTVQGSHHNIFQFGKLTPINKPIHGTLGRLIDFQEPVSMKPLLNVRNSAGKIFSFLRVKTFLAANFNREALPRYIATEGWYKEMNGTNQIEVVIDAKQRKVICSLSPWFSRETQFNIVRIEQGLLVAMSQNLETKLVIDFNKMTLTAGDSRDPNSLSFGKALTSKLSIKK